MTSSRTPRGDLCVAILALGLGLSADRLLWLGPEGAGFAVWIALLAASAMVLARRLGLEWSGAVAGWGGVAVAASGLMVWRSSPELRLLLLVCLGAAASMVVMRAQGRRLWRTLPGDHLLALAAVPASAAVGAIRVLTGIDRKALPERRRVLALSRGALLAVPLLLVFGSLFASADPVFDRYVTRAATFYSEDLPAHALLVVAFTWLGAGLLSAVRPGAGVIDVGRRPRVPRLGVEELSVALGLLAALFVVFVVLQLGYLFGGRAVIETTTGLTVAEYARRGFFELVVVAGLVLAVLLGASGSISEGASRWVYRGLAGTLVACVLVILASAVQRLRLYQLEFGLTMDRVLAATIMLWLAVVFVMFAATVLRGRPARFGSGAVVAGLTIVLGLSLLNPEALIARSNLARGGDDADHDVGYLLTLSADAVPALLEGWPELDAHEQCLVAYFLLNRPPDRQASTDWRRWNASTAAAEEAIRDMRPRLAATLQRDVEGCDHDPPRDAPPGLEAT